MKASEFDRNFDEGESVLEELDLASARQLNLEQRKVNVDFPVWMTEALDRSAREMGVTRQSVIKMWLAERLKQENTAAHS